MEVAVGSVLHFYSHLASKNKFHIVVCLNQKKLAFFINSRPTKYAESMPHLMACKPTILESEHDFLNYDSVIDCCEAISIADQLPTLSEEHHVGMLSERAKVSVLNGAEASKMLSGRDKTMILESLGN